MDQMQKNWWESELGTQILDFLSGSFNKKWLRWIPLNSICKLLFKYVYVKNVIVTIGKLEDVKIWLPNFKSHMCMHRKNDFKHFLSMPYTYSLLHVLSNALAVHHHNYINHKPFILNKKLKEIYILYLKAHQENF